MMIDYDYLNVHEKRQCSSCSCLRIVIVKLGHGRTCGRLKAGSMVGPMKTIQPPLVSVIMPTFNRSWSLKKAIDSVLSQEYASLETIVVDDGSTDDTPALLSSYGTRIRVIRQANQGVSAARNAGIRAAQGELITLLDSDDAWLPGKVQAQVDFLTPIPTP